MPGPGTLHPVPTACTGATGWVNRGRTIRLVSSRTSSSCGPTTAQRNAIRPTSSIGTTTVLREAARGSLLSIIIEKNVPVTMDDGVKLLADVYRPGSTDRCPVLLTRLPYNKEVGQMVSDTFDVLRAVQAGYAVVVQDTRGRFASDGAFKPFFNEAVDGASTIAWAASQPWSTGSVGMFGASYVGATQWTAATQAPPALRAIAPFVTTDQYYDSWAYQGGAFQLGFNLHWAFLSLALGEVARQMGTGAAGPEDLSAMIAALDDNDELYWRLPLRGPVELKDLAPYYDDWLDHPSYDQFWKATAPCESFGRIVVPALNVGGWYDIFLKGTLASYVGMKRQGGSEEARRRQRLVVGPWAHGAYTGWFPERSFGFLAATGNADITGLQLRWFDWLLKGVDTGLAGEKPVRLFVMGVNEWRDADDWPVPGTRYVDYFLHSGGQANSAAGDGLLSTNAPGDEPEDVYLYDPRHPVPTTGGGDVPAGALHRRQRRAARPTWPGEPPGCPLLHHRAARRAGRGHRTGQAGPARVVVRSRHRLHRQAVRRGPRWDTGELDRRYPPRPVPGAAGGPVPHGARPDLRDHPGPGRHGQRVRRRPPHPPRGVQQQLPPLRPQHQHGRSDCHRGRDRFPPRRQPGPPPPLPAVTPGPAGPRPSRGPPLSANLLQWTWPENAVSCCRHAFDDDHHSEGQAPALCGDTVHRGPLAGRRRRP